MAEQEKKANAGKEKDEKFVCKICDTTYEITEARKKEFACCGQRLTRTEIATKSTPTPFGP